LRICNCKKRTKLKCVNNDLQVYTKLGSLTTRTPWNLSQKNPNWINEKIFHVKESGRLSSVASLHLQQPVLHLISKLVKKNCPISKTYTGHTI
jgi:hypothetical protein